MTQQVSFGGSSSVVESAWAVGDHIARYELDGTSFVMQHLDRDGATYRVRFCGSEVCWWWCGVCKELC